MTIIDPDSPLRGVIPPVTTPLTAGGDVDIESLSRLIEFEIDAGVHAIFALGTGGEGPYLTHTQKREVLATVVAANAGRIPVLAGIGDIGTAKVLENLALASEFDIDGVVSTAPFFGAVGPKEIEAHFRLIAAATALPLFAYDIPAFAGVKIPAELTVELAHEGVIRGVKDTSGEEDGFRYIIENTRSIPGFSVITGSDITGDAALFQGAHGMIVGVANIDPHGYVGVYRAMMAGDFDAARTEQERLHRLRLVAKIAAGRIGSFSATIGAFKAAQVTRGIIAEDLLQAPLLQLNDEEKRAVDAVLAQQQLGAITNSKDGVGVGEKL
jgi:4-hydroxy-tetrahydrodipicolinate synthase